MLPQITTKIQDMGTITFRKITCPYKIRDIDGRIFFEVIEVSQEAMNNGHSDLPERVTVKNIWSDKGSPDAGENVQEVLQNCLEWCLDEKDISGDEFVFIKNAILHELMRNGVNLEQRINDE